jgi:hypothetical protein
MALELLNGFNGGYEIMKKTLTSCLVVAFLMSSFAFAADQKAVSSAVAVKATQTDAVKKSYKKKRKKHLLQKQDAASSANTSAATPVTAAGAAAATAPVNSQQK